MFQPNISCRRRDAKLGSLNTNFVRKKQCQGFGQLGSVFKTQNRQNGVVGPRICTITTVTKIRETLFAHIMLKPLTPNDPYSGRTAPLTSKVTFYVFI